MQLASETALKVWKALGCRDAGRVDLRSDKLGNLSYLFLFFLLLLPLFSDLPLLFLLFFFLRFVIGEGAVPHFLEVNPLAGLRPNYSHLSSIADYNGVSYVQLVDIIVKSAMERTSKKRNT